MWLVKNCPNIFLLCITLHFSKEEKIRLESMVSFEGLILLTL